MGVDKHEQRVYNGNIDHNPACKAHSNKATKNSAPIGAIGSWKSGKSRGEVIRDFYRQRAAKRNTERRPINGQTA